MIHAPQRIRAEAASRTGGFTLIEVLLVVMLIGLIIGMIVPNLGAFVPKARLDAAARIVTANIDYMRSEARIQGKRCSLEFDIEQGVWRRVLPPEDRLTSDQDITPVEPEFEDWTPLYEGVTIVGAGNLNQGMARRGVFALVFDTNGHTSDQSIVLRLTDDPTMVWTIHIKGLTGSCEVVENFQGKESLPEDANEGSF